MNNKMTHGCPAIALRFLTGAMMVLAAGAHFTEAHAEEADSPSEPTAVSTTAAPSQTDSEKSPQPATKAIKKPDAFTPSEEISEDFAVSFPVDI